VLTNGGCEGRQMNFCRKADDDDGEKGRLGSTGRRRFGSSPTPGRGKTDATRRRGTRGGIGLLRDDS
jgi:hypothetical protein